MPGPWEKYQSNSTPNQPTGQSAGPWVKYGGQGESLPPMPKAPIPTELQNTPQTTLQKVTGTAEDLGIGAGRGALSTIRNVGDLVSGGRVSPIMGSLTEPANTAQSIGKGMEQAGEFLIPAAGETKAGELAAEAFPKVARYIAPLTRVAFNGIGSGLVNKAQGGSFGTGAATGLIGGALGEGLRAAAPRLAESAIGIRKNDRFYGKTPGIGILNDTRGYRPGTIADTAQQSIGGLSKQLVKMAGSSNSNASLSPARKIIADAIDAAGRENNEKGIAQLRPFQRLLNTNVTNELPLSSTQNPIAILNLKRGLGDAISSWNPETTKGVNNTAKRAYRALDEELDRAVPGAAPINQRISSLIPVAKRAESTAHNADLGQRVLGRIAAHTGAATGGVGGAVAGYHEKGTPGAIVGGLLGLTAPEAVSSPTVRMIAARAMHSPLGRSTAGPLIRGAALQADRPK